MSEKSIVQEARDIQLAMELINLGARLQMLESETQLSRGRLIRLYKELRGSPPPKGMLPFSTELVYDLGAKYSCLHVLQRLAIFTEDRLMQRCGCGD
ncbi:flagellar transcriptional activator FlhC [Salmonella enterica subsp. enterica serovar Typhimurium]